MSLLAVNWKKSCYPIALPILFLVLLSSCKEGNTAAVKILDLKPTPNYKLCTDEEDVNQLTDGKTERYPIWKRKGCVGWNQSGLAKILLQIGDTPGPGPISGTLLIHTGKGLYAGVEVPSRIDVYTLSSNGHYHYAGGESFHPESMADRKNHWIAMDLDYVQSRNLIIIRPTGSFLFVDEIHWRNRDCSRPQAHPFVGMTIDCEKDSTERHRQTLLSKICIPTGVEKSWSDAFGEEKIVTWVTENPFSLLPSKPTAGLIVKSPKHIELVGCRSESESACIGLLNSGKNEKALYISLDCVENLKPWIQIKQVQRILAADGRLVYDPLIPLEEENRIVVSPHRASYLWFQLNLDGFSPGQHTFFIDITDKSIGVLCRIPVNVLVAPHQLSATRRPEAVNWAYTTDKPIWDNPDKILSDLLRHGINVFVIHPSNIPMPSMKGTWDSGREKKFASDIALYNGKGRILLFLGWGRGRGPSWLRPSKKHNREKQRTAIKTWIFGLKSFIEDQGVKKTDWAIYPIDEPRGADFLYLQRLAKWIKEVDPKIQIYANPISTHKNKTKSADLVPLDKLVDIWQPPLGLSTGSASDFFKHLSKPWWIYSNPPSPAKSASPWKYYRLSSWRAWVSGAKGIGFWSYSDTAGSSAWDDLDGRRPDFAVVYEGQDGPISSRRWEAFREGIEDFQLLESVSSGDLPSSNRLASGIRSKVQDMFNQSSITLTAVNYLRKEMIKEYSVFPFEDIGNHSSP